MSPEGEGRPDAGLGAPGWPPGTWTAATLLGLLALVLRGIVPSGAPWAPAPVLVAVLVGLGLLGAVASRGEPPGGAVTRDPGVRVLVAALGLLLGILLSHHFRLTSDGIDHFVYLRSVWVDHDLDLANDYAAVAPPGYAVPPPTPLGRTGNVHPVGPALSWVPFYALADGLCRLTGRPTDGQNDLYKNAVSIASALYGWLGLVLLYRLASATAGRACALLATLGIGFGTFLFWYLAYAPTMAHAPAFGAAALVLYLWLDPELGGRRRALLLGAACGLAALMRWADGLLVLLPLVVALPRLRRRSEWVPLCHEGLIFATAALVVFSPQMIVWKRLYGSFLTVPQGTGFVLGRPAVSGVLFSPWHGLFSWSPLLYLGVLGLLVFFRREPLRGLAAALFLGGLLRVNAGVADWWGGAAFGARRFDAALPLLGLGLALAFSQGARWTARHPLVVPAGLLAAFVGWNLALASQYRSGAWDYSEPVTFEDMGRGAVSLVDRSVGSPFSLPGALLEWWRSGRPLSAYESLFEERRHARWSVRMGLDERIFLQEGWSSPRRSEGVDNRLLEGPASVVVVPLHRAEPYTLGARVAVDPPGATARVRVLVNDRVAGSWAVHGGWSDYTLDVGPEPWHTGRNLLTFKILDGANETVALAGLWVEPSRPQKAE